MNPHNSESGFVLQQGIIPLMVSFPHLGTDIPVELQSHYVPRALQTEDTDWHLDRLYDFVADMGASTLMPRYSRYVIDLNRPPDDQPMYPGASNTELCPTRFFSGEALYQEGRAPDAREQLRRRQQYWQPYHDALAAELARLRSLFGFVLLWDAHSIRSEIPWLFEGRLPDLNIGTANGAAADESIAAAVANACQGVPGVSSILNGRFKGGYTTRHYGRPLEHQHVVQLEKCQSLYMQEEPPYAFLPDRADKTRPVLQAMVHAAFKATRKLYGQ